VNGIPKLEILDRSEAQVAARYGPLLISCWRGNGSIELIRQLQQHHYEQRRRYPDGYLSLTILEHGVPLERNQELVEYGRSVRTEFGPNIVRQAYVIPHAGVGGTMLRLMVNNAMRLVSGAHVRICQTLPEALRWFEDGPISIHDQELLEQELSTNLGLRQSTLRSSVPRGEG
jgi:hypothetical protein